MNWLLIGGAVAAGALLLKKKKVETKIPPPPPPPVFPTGPGTENGNGNGNKNGKDANGGSVVENEGKDESDLAKGKGYTKDTTGGGKKLGGKKSSKIHIPAGSLKLGTQTSATCIKAVWGVAYCKATLGSSGVDMWQDWTLSQRVKAGRPKGYPFTVPIAERKPGQESVGMHASDGYWDLFKFGKTYYAVPRKHKLAAPPGSLKLGTQTSATCIKAVWGVAYCKATLGSSGVDMWQDWTLSQRVKAGRPKGYPFTVPIAERKPGQESVGMHASDGYWDLFKFGKTYYAVPRKHKLAAPPGGSITTGPGDKPGTTIVGGGPGGGGGIHKPLLGCGTGGYYNCD